MHDLDCFFLSVKVVTDGQLPGVRGLRGHFLPTVTFHVFVHLSKDSVGVRSNSAGGRFHTS